MAKSVDARDLKSLGRKAVQVTLGITDGVYSEVVSGDLEEKQEVAIASNNAAASGRSEAAARAQAARKALVVA